MYFDSDLSTGVMSCAFVSVCTAFSCVAECPMVWGGSVYSVGRCCVIAQRRAHVRASLDVCRCRTVPCPRPQRAHTFVPAGIASRTRARSQGVKYLCQVMHHTHTHTCRTSWRRDAFKKRRHTHTHTHERICGCIDVSVPATSAVSVTQCTPKLRQNVFSLRMSVSSGTP